MNQKVNSYKIGKISLDLAKEFGRIRDGEEEFYCDLLQCMEVNMLKINQRNHKCNSIRAQEAIHICLMNIDGYIKEMEYDLGNYINDENKILSEALLMSFDPFTNADLKKEVKNLYDLGNKEEMKKYFAIPVKCLLKIEKSIETWLKNMGNDGYFNFLKNQIGNYVSNDDKMEFTFIKEQ
jgi:hypothetical protein